MKGRKECPDLGYSNIGIRTKELRERHNLTQAEVADALGLQRTAYNEKEGGRTHYNIRQILTLSMLYNVSTDYILMGVDNQNKTLAEDLGLSNNSIKYLTLTANDTPEKRAINTLLYTQEGRRALVAFATAYLQAGDDNK